MNVVLRDYQKEAVAAFLKAGKGTLKIHSGGGKTIIAAAIIEALRERTTDSKLYTLVVVPTIDLVHQWERVLAEQGVVHTLVITYAKATRLFKTNSLWFDSWGILVFDEAHHLADGEQWRRLLIPAFRARYTLGLTATPPTDPVNYMLRVLPVLYERALSIGTDEGYAAPVEIRPVPVPLMDEERKRYTELTEKIRVGLLKHGNRFNHPEVGPVTTERKKLVSMAENKFEALTTLIGTIIQQDNPDRIFVWNEFVDALEHIKDHLDGHNRTGLGVSITSMVVTGETPKAERKRLLTEAWGKEFRVLLIAKIGEEGLDYPEVAHGVIVAGAKTSRQNMQRIGRLLRPMPPGKTAKLWVVFAERTMEERILDMVDRVTDE